MKNKIRLIDVNILSTYMGRWMTIISIVIVAALTLSSLYGTRRGQHNIISVCVPTDVNEDVFEPFRVLLGRETRRPVTLTPVSEAIPDGCDVYVLRTIDYLRHRRALDLEPLYEVLDTDRHNDQAVIFARSDDAIELNKIAGKEIAFVSPTSINGYWAQASMLSDVGVSLDAGERSFVGGASDATRVIFAVLYGDYRVGACRLSEITRMRQASTLRTGELTIIDKTDALPEMIIAAHSKDASYYRRKLKGVGDRLAGDSSGNGQGETVRLLKSVGFKGLAAVTPARLENTERLGREFGGVDGSPAP